MSREVGRKIAGAVLLALSLACYPRCAMSSPKSDAAKADKARITAFACREKKQYKKAEAAFREYLPSMPDNHHKISIMLQIAQMVENQGRNTDAEKEYLSAIDEAQKHGWYEEARTARCSFAEFLHRIGGREDDVQKIKALVNDKHCPVCHSDAQVQKIGYGRTTFKPGVPHGGCCILRSSALDIQISPVWHCDKDKVSF